jgi:DNA-binding PadR family transcriptional regulator
VNHRQEETCFVLDLAVLGLLKEAPMSGYELKKQLSVNLGAFWRVSYGSLYPCLKRLAGEGALDVEVAPFTSRKKHVYRLTDQGNRLFHQLLESADGHEHEQDRFSMRLAFFRYLRPEARLYQLERRRGYLQERLADLRASVRTARERMDAYAIELMDHGLDEREREIAWLDRLIARERRSTEPQREQDPTGPQPSAQVPQSPRDPRLPAQTG